MWPLQQKSKVRARMRCTALKRPGPSESKKSLARTERSQAQMHIARLRKHCKNQLLWEKMSLTRKKHKQGGCLHQGTRCACPVCMLHIWVLETGDLQGSEIQ